MKQPEEEEEITSMSYNYHHKEITKEFKEEGEKYLTEYKEKKKKIEKEIQNLDEKRRAIEDLKIWYHTETTKKCLKLALEDKGLDIKDGLNFIKELISPLSSPRSATTSSSSNQQREENFENQKINVKKTKDKEEKIEVHTESSE